LIAGSAFVVDGVLVIFIDYEYTQNIKNEEWILTLSGFYSKS